MTPKQEERFIEVLAWVCTAIFIASVIFLITSII
jgi:hypothetical protein